MHISREGLIHRQPRATRCPPPGWRLLLLNTSVKIVLRICTIKGIVNIHNINIGKKCHSRLRFRSGEVTLCGICVQNEHNRWCPRCFRRNGKTEASRASRPLPRRTPTFSATCTAGSRSTSSRSSLERASRRALRQEK